MLYSWNHATYRDSTCNRKTGGLSSSARQQPNLATDDYRKLLAEDSLANPEGVLIIHSEIHLDMAKTPETFDALR
ncbi:hypothetical protein JTB14_014887 [Gonioctena quinquepunctata]|nr:hypothetical protein JTB14_014887 [Gonioctena quinquepunctata]